MERLTEKERMELSARNEDVWQDFWDSVVNERLAHVDVEKAKRFLGLDNSALAELESYYGNPTIDQIKRYLFLIGHSLKMEHAPFEDRKTVSMTFENMTDGMANMDDMLYGGSAWSSAHPLEMGHANV